MDVVYLIASGTSFATSLAWKLDIGLRNIRFVAVSPSLRQVLVVKENSESAIVSIAPFLNFIVPHSIDTLHPIESFPLSLLGLEGGWSSLPA
jgi:hypothetical protein